MFYAKSDTPLVHSVTCQF